MKGEGKLATCDFCLMPPVTAISSQMGRTELCVYHTQEFSGIREDDLPYEVRPYDDHVKRSVRRSAEKRKAVGRARQGLLL